MAHESVEVHENDKTCYRFSLSHPDYNRRLWNHTRSAWPCRYCRRSRAVLCRNHRRWGVSPRPENMLHEPPMVI